MSTVIVDYGVGNLFSLKSSFAAIGEDAVVTGDETVISSAERIVLPGVGAFGDAASRLSEKGLDTVLTRCAASGVPLLGICLGMQLLFSESLEYGHFRGLGLLPGTVRPIADAAGSAVKIPHMGWNSLHIVKEHPLFRHTAEGTYVYFVHSYYAADCGGALLATTDYGAPLTAAVADGNVMGCQFHPEKSGEAGLSILRAFCGMKRGALC